MTTSPRFQLAGLQGAPGDRRRRLAHHHGKGRDLGLLAEHPELLLRGRPARIQRGHQNALALFLGQELADLGGCGGLAGALEADDHNDGRRLGPQVDLLDLAAEGVDQHVVDDLDDLLAGRDAFQDFGADRAFLDPVDEIPDDRQRDIGLEQHHADLAQRGRNVRLAERAAAGQFVEYIAQSVRQAVEHACVRRSFSVVLPNANRARVRTFAYGRAPSGAPWAVRR